MIVACQKNEDPPGPLEFSKDIVTLGWKIDNAFKNNDAAALAPFYAEDAVLITREGMFKGRTAIAKYWVDLFGKVSFSNHLLDLDTFSVHVIGNSGDAALATLRFSQTAEGLDLGNGYWSCVFVYEGDVLKILSQAITATPTGTPSPTTSPGNR